MNPQKIAGTIVGGVAVGIVVLLLGIIGIFLFAVLGALIGAITGWIVAHTPVLGDVVRTGFASVFGIESPDLVAIGAMLGFIAGFFKNWGNGGHDWKKHERPSMEEEFQKKEWPEVPEVHIDVKPKKKTSKKKK
ncbi:hypothetical protein GF318_06010 [Candidatus Micrarchaeota archaeon]|nr:hypothetical protein [Candidatus Micrarchaeota archaeon]